MAVKMIQKRDGRMVAFDVQKIANAIRKSFDASGYEGFDETALVLAQKIEKIFLITLRILHLSE